MFKLDKFFQLEKYDPFRGIATGVATAEAKDRDNEILDYLKSKPFFEAWSESVHKDSGGKSVGNLRLQHDDKKVAGRLNEIEFNDDAKLIRVVAQVVDPVAKELLETGCLTGFSIGGRYVEKTQDKDGTTRYVADPCEISVVDRPCLPEAVFQSVKADGTVELKKFAKVTTETPEAQVTHIAVPKTTEPIIVDAEGHKENASEEEEKPEDDGTEKTTKGVHYLVPDGKHLPVSGEDGKPNHRLMGAAWAALHGGYRGNKYEGPDKDKAISELKSLYEREGMDCPSAEKAFTDLLDLFKGGDIQASNEYISELLEEIEKMATKDEVLTLDKAARHSVHQKIAAAKVAHTKHLEMCKAHHDAMHAHMDGISKVLGGGPESQAEGGEAEHVTEGRGAGAPQSPGASETAGKAQYVECGKDAHGNALFKRIEADRPLTTADLADFGKTIVKSLLEVQKASVDAIGDRNKVEPYVKAMRKEDDAAGGHGAEDTGDKMTKEDWDAYGKGDQKAIAKAQRCTGAKWGPVPSRIMNRQAEQATAGRA